MPIADDLDGYAKRGAAAQAKAAQAYARLLEIAETRSNGQVRRVAAFLAATFDGGCCPFDLYELRAVDIDISDDMMICIDALRWAKADLRKSTGMSMRCCGIGSPAKRPEG